MVLWNFVEIFNHPAFQCFHRFVENKKPCVDDHQRRAFVQMIKKLSFFTPWRFVNQSDAETDD